MFINFNEKKRKKTNLFHWGKKMNSQLKVLKIFKKWKGLKASKGFKNYKGFKVRVISFEMLESGKVVFFALICNS